MNLWGKCVVGSAVEYRIEVRLSDCVIRRSLSLLSLLLVALRLVIRVLAAVHVEVVGIASERSARVEGFFTFLSTIFSRSLLFCRLVEHLADHGAE
jgi:hypothetical protein